MNSQQLLIRGIYYQSSHLACSREIDIIYNYLYLCSVLWRIYLKIYLFSLAKSVSRPILLFYKQKILKWKELWCAKPRLENLNWNGFRTPSLALTSKMVCLVRSEHHFCILLELGKSSHNGNCINPHKFLRRAIMFNFIIGSKWNL